MNPTKIPLLLRSASTCFTTAASWLQSPLLLAIRLYWGWSFCQTGWGKLRHFEQTVTNFRDRFHLPFPQLNAALASVTECAGGALLALGLASRLTCIPLIVTMIVAYITTEQEALQALFKDAEPFFSATPFLFLYASVIILAFGPGAISLDRLIARKFLTKPEYVPS